MTVALEAHSNHWVCPRPAFVQIEAFERIEIAFPWRFGQHRTAIVQTCLPARADSGTAEVEILHMVLAPDLWGEEPDNVHPCQTAIARHFPDSIAPALRFGQPGGKLGNNMAQAVNLFLPPDVTDGAARILNILLAVENLRDRLRLRPIRVPDVDSEHNGITAR